MSDNQLIIASRESALAMWQARHILNRIQEIAPQFSLKILGMTTKGDQITDRPLQEIGGKGLFIKELEISLQEGRADLAVHSLKDVPMDMPDGFILAAFPQRELANDAFVSNDFTSLDEMPENSLVGTSSQRRQAILQQYYPHLRIEALRGNLQTRLAKLDQGKYSAIILAAAGLIRLDLASRIKHILPLERFIPAPGQGALAIEILSGRSDLVQLLSALEHNPTTLAVRAERAFSRALGGSCQVAIGAHAVLAEQILTLNAFYVDNQQFLHGQISAKSSDNDFLQPENLGEKLAQQLQSCVT